MRTPRRALMACSAALAFAAVGSYAGDAHAGGERWQELAWVYASPGLLAVPMLQRNFVQLDATWQWAIGGGYMMEPIDKLWIMPGGSFEHMILNPSLARGRGSQFRIVPEVRIGSGINRVFIYGLAGAGLGLMHTRIVDPSDDTVARRTDGGFNLEVGAGAMFNVWDSLSVGGELDADLGWYRASRCEIECGYAVHIMGIKAVVGYQF